jgi:hypothetical protein
MDVNQSASRHFREYRNLSQYDIKQQAERKGVQTATGDNDDVWQQSFRHNIYGRGRYSNTKFTCDGEIVMRNWFISERPNLFDPHSHHFLTNSC